MKSSVLNNKRLLIVDDEPDILDIVSEEIVDASPEVKIDTASSFEEAAAFLNSKEYDLVILDIMGVRGFDLLEIAVAKKRKVAMLTAHALNSDALKKSHDMGAMAYLPKDKLGEIVPFLEDVLRYEYKSAWERLIEKLGEYYSKKFEKDINNYLHI